MELVDFKTVNLDILQGLELIRKLDIRFNEIAKYQRGKIYRLDGNGCTYYGSTTQKISSRKSKHRSNLKCYEKNGTYHYVSSFKCFENNCDPQISLIELYPCNTKKELEARERWYVENNECCNKNLPAGRSVHGKSKGEWSFCDKKKT